jgi:ankyrin repeat protein
MTTSLAFAAIVNGDLDALTAALDAGTDPNARRKGWTLLMEAVYWDRLYMVDVLLSRGANVHQKDPYGQTALHFAAREWRSGVFRRIFSEMGPHAMNFPNWRGWTPLHHLAHYGSAEQMAYALSHPGLDISIQTDSKRTPLDLSNNFRRALVDCVRSRQGLLMMPPSKHAANVANAALRIVAACAKQSCVGPNCTRAHSMCIR